MSKGKKKSAGDFPAEILVRIEVINKESFMITGSYDDVLDGSANGEAVGRYELVSVDRVIKTVGLE